MNECHKTKSYTTIVEGLKENGGILTFISHPLLLDELLYFDVWCL